MPRIEISDEAQAEIEEAVAYYEAIDPVLADDLLDRIERGLNRISDLPEAWPTYLFGTRRFLLRKFSYALVFRILNDHAYVVAFCHHSRKPGYWSDR